jgi:hypothetical protein
MITNFSRTEKCVNSKILMKTVCSRFESILATPIMLSEQSNRDLLTQFMEDIIFPEMDKAGLITQSHIIFDGRNNCDRNTAKGIYTIMIKYKQKNCLNTTILEYTITQTKNSSYPPFPPIW